MAHPNFPQPQTTRRSLLKSAVFGSVAAIAAPYVKDSYAAGSLALGVWDHWVPGANHAFAALCNEWGTKNNVEVRIDFITSQGEKDKLTAAAEAQAGTGHDIMSHRDWSIRTNAELLEPLDNPKVSENCWTHPMPRGPKGRFVGQLPQFYGLWSFSKNKAAAKDFLLFISQEPQVAKLVEASFGYDLPSFRSMYDLDTWKTVGPPLGTVYGYPPRADEQTSIAGAPARSEVGAQIYNQAINTVMVAKFTQGGEKFDAVIKWAENELQGTLRS